MLDVAVSYNRYKFLGYEFLTWLWFVIENEPNLLHDLDKDLSVLQVGNRLVLMKQWGESKETITIKGNDAGLEEGMLALRKGAMVTEMNLLYMAGESEWRFNIKGESFHIANLKTPETGSVETEDDLEGAVLEKIYLFEKITSLIDKVYAHFLNLRISDKWIGNEVPRMRNWIRSD